jgi:hypothetical protein
MVGLLRNLYPSICKWVGKTNQYFSLYFRPIRIRTLVRLSPVIRNGNLIRPQIIGIGDYHVQPLFQDIIESENNNIKNYRKKYEPQLPTRQEQIDRSNYRKLMGW